MILRFLFADDTVFHDVLYCTEYTKIKDIFDNNMLYGASLSNIPIIFSGRLQIYLNKIIQRQEDYFKNYAQIQSIVLYILVLCVFGRFT